MRDRDDGAAALRSTATTGAEYSAGLLKSGKFMAVCKTCADNYPEGCAHSSFDTLRVAPNGDWICDGCWDDEPQNDTRWGDLPRISAIAALPPPAGESVTTHILARAIEPSASGYTREFHDAEMLAEKLLSTFTITRKNSEPRS